MKSFIYLKSGVVSFFLLFFSFNIVSAANLSFSPLSGTYTTGSTITVDVLVSSTDKAVNTVSSLISFPANILSVSSISIKDSIVNSWAQQPTFSNAFGNISFEDEILPSGFIGNSGKLLTITFKVKSIGMAKINFVAGSILTADGVRTDILTSSNNAFFEISAVNQNKPEIIDSQKNMNVILVASETPPVTYTNYNNAYAMKNVNFLAMLISPATFIIVLVLILWCLWFTFFRKEKKLKKEVSDVKGVLHKASNLLKESAQEQIKALEKVKIKRQLTVEEEKIRKHLKKDLDDAEKYIKKEIDDVDELL